MPGRYSSKKALPLPKIKPCHVVLNNIQGLLDKDGVYIVPGRSRRALTCYRCFKKFNSAESLEVHKAEHEPESEEENVYAVSDSENEIESESAEETNELVVVSSQLQSEEKTVEESPAQKNTEVVENVQKTAETAAPKQVQVVEPIRSKVDATPKKQPIQQQEKKGEEPKKVPVLCNIQIRCLTCDVLFTNSELLMKHKPVVADNQCCFTCKVCTESYSQPEDYLNHIMQHNTFSSSRYGYRVGNRKKPEYRCTYCRLDFEHRFLLKQHEDMHHKTPRESVAVAPAVATPPKIQAPPASATPAKIQVAPAVATPAIIQAPPALATPAKIQTPPALSTPAKIQVAPALATSAKIQVVPVDNLPKLVPIVLMTDTKKPAAAVTQPATPIVEPPTQDAPKPKIWVIKEALMKSPEPPVDPKPVVTSTGLSGVKRNIDQLQVHEELLKPPKKGRPSKTSSIAPPIILNPTVSVVKGVDATNTLTCDICFDVFQNRAAFEEHMVFHGDKKNVEESVPNTANNVKTPEAHECPTCKLHFKSHAGLRRHQTCAHENKKLTSFVCSKCTKIFSSRKGLNLHKNSCLGNTLGDPL